jgi:Glycosyl transferase family 2
VLTVVVTDGRGEYLRRTLTAAEEMIPDFELALVDDTGEVGYASWVTETWPKATVVHHRERQGLGGAVKSAWELASSHPDPFFLHLEDDMVLLQPVDIEAMVRTMRANPRLAQLVLMRQPWGEEEKAAGAVLKAYPGRYEQRDGWVEQVNGPLYSFTPHLARREAVLDALEHSANFLEAGVTAALLERGWKFGIWGNWDDPPRVEHIGVEHSAGYRW